MFLLFTEILKLIHSNSKLGITKDILACKIIPFLMPICVENKLDLTQFEMAIGMIKEMVEFVETEHRNKLKLLSSKDEPSRYVKLLYILFRKLTNSITECLRCIVDRKKQWFYQIVL